MREIHIHKNKLGEFEQVIQNPVMEGLGNQIAVIPVRAVFIVHAVNEYGVMTFSTGNAPAQCVARSTGESYELDCDTHEVQLIFKVTKKEAA